MEFLETLYYYFQMLMDYLLGKEAADEYHEYADRKISMENPLHFETHSVYPCKETF